MSPLPAKSRQAVKKPSNKRSSSSSRTPGPVRHPGRAAPAPFAGIGPAHLRHPAVLFKRAGARRVLSLPGFLLMAGDGPAAGGGPLYTPKPSRPGGLLPRIRRGGRTAALEDGASDLVGRVADGVFRISPGGPGDPLPLARLAGRGRRYPRGRDRSYLGGHAGLGADGPVLAEKALEIQSGKIGLDICVPPVDWKVCGDPAQ